MSLQNENKLKLSVCTITYNHEKYIHETIKSIINQKTDFDFELIIGEDFSSDNTKMICLEYAEKYPKLIKLMNSEKNIGVVPNFIRTIKSCSGKYIALCEGDDYWTDPFKLQKQVDFLDANPNYVCCFHNTEEITEGGSIPSFLYCDKNQKTINTINDLAYRNFIPTCSVVFRNRLFDEFPDWFMNMSIGDWILHIFNAQYGKIYYMPEIMGVHRLHDGGVWSSNFQLKNMEEIIKTYNVLIVHFNDNKVFCKHLKIGRERLIDNYRLLKYKNFTFKYFSLRLILKIKRLINIFKKKEEL
jgi:glycosyltransferase involved in cell wall biosynthesis